MPLLIIAHRGDSAHRPENTLASFASALEVGADIVELDVQLTADREVVVIHDPTLERTTSGAGPVVERTLAEIRALSAGYPARFGAAWEAERVPTLEEVLALLKGRARVLVEIKKESVTGNTTDGIEARTVATLRRAGMADAAVLISFDRRALLRCRDLAPEIPRGHLFYKATAEEIVAGAAEVRSELVMPHKEMLSDALFEAAAAAGLKVATWVVDDEADLRALQRFPLFAVGSNRPGPLLRAARAL
jgi:glycerophosphoryl diester phosphodiesterase